jgi:hypothetical protein
MQIQLRHPRKTEFGTENDRRIEKMRREPKYTTGWRQAHLAEYVCTPPNISKSIIRVASREQRCAVTTSTAAAEQ